jgi:hypothetical protein
LGKTSEVVRIARECTYIQGGVKERRGVVREWMDVLLQPQSTNNIPICLMFYFCHAE